MPLIYLHCPEKTFSTEAKNELAEELTTIALAVENLPDTPFVRSTCWIYINEYTTTNVYHGGVSAGRKVISMEINAFEGGLNPLAKGKIIKMFTNGISKHTGLQPNDLNPVYIIFRDIATSDWAYLEIRLRWPTFTTRVQMLNQFDKSIKLLTLK